MPRIDPESTIKQCQDFIRDVYGRPNDRHFSLWDMLSNMERFTMRALKGIRKNDKNKTKFNLLISIGWFMSTLNSLHIDLDESLWKRFPHLCSYCASSPCSCAENKIEKRKDIPINDSKRPVTLNGFQSMFGEIYPAENRSIEHAAVHLAEELGEFSESILTYMGEHKDELFEKVITESADVFSCIIGVFNSLGISMAKEISELFSGNCHVCKKAPCECNFGSIVKFRS